MEKRSGSKNYGSRTATWLFIGGYSLGWINWFMLATVWSQGALYQAIMNGVLMGSFVMIVAAAFMLLIKNGGFLFSIPSVKAKFVGILVFAWIMLIIGAPNYVLPEGQTLSKTAYLFISDLGSMSYYLSPLALAALSKEEWRCFILASVVVVVLVFVISSDQMDFVRNATFTSRSHILDDQELGSWAGLHNGIAGAIISIAAVGVFLLRDRLGVAYAIGAVPVVLFSAVYYSKRQPVLELALFFFFVALFALKSELPRTQRRILVVFAGVIGYLLFDLASSQTVASLLERWTDRVADVGSSGVMNFDRIAEARLLFENENPIVLVATGFGIASTSDLLIANSYAHIGGVTLLFKGGLPFALFVLGILLTNVVRALSSRTMEYRFLVLFLTCLTLLQMGFAPLWGFWPTMMGLGLGFFAPEFALIHARLYDRPSRS